MIRFPSRYSSKKLPWSKASLIAWLAVVQIVATAKRPLCKHLLRGNIDVPRDTSSKHRIDEDQTVRLVAYSSEQVPGIYGINPWKHIRIPSAEFFYQWNSLEWGCRSETQKNSTNAGRERRRYRLKRAETFREKRENKKKRAASLSRLCPDGKIINSQRRNAKIRQGQVQRLLKDKRTEGAACMWAALTENKVE